MAPNTSSSFGSVPERPDFAKIEEDVGKFWVDIDAFQESMRQSKAENRPPYTFYDGPPFATGLPHYGHILAGSLKDTVTRYAHQSGFHVSRRFGWDCHGLPVEYEIDKQLNISSSDDVAAMGIKTYNAHCRSIVDRYTSDWERIITRLGRWIDFKDDYKTMDPTYMESIWWVFKTIHSKGLVYQGFKVMPYSTACTTPLSNFEAGLNYKDVSDPSVYVTFPTVDDPKRKFIAWTTTPWTLPSNLALCVHPDLTYVEIKDLKSGDNFILLESRLSELYPGLKKPKKYKAGSEFELVTKYTGKELGGIKYTPLFDYFKEDFVENGFKVLVDSYVTDDSGTGVVHQAPAFGAEDYSNCLRAGVITKNGTLPCPLDPNGRFTDVVSDFKGIHVKEADPKIIEHIKTQGRLIKKEQIVHSYPFCWRSDTPLLYKAVPSWFVAVEEIKEKLLANNAKTHWVPKFVKEKRFHNWLENAIDWNVSRNRYWGTPIPIWTSEDGEEIVVIGSVEELETLSGTKVTDLHRESVDDILIPSKQGKGMLKRIPEVFDCWFESGSMPYAQKHYPFENKEEFEGGFPADFIAEGLDQTRGWFYTLMVLSTALFDKPAFKNLIVNGLVLAEDGKKMSKRLKNYPDPLEVISKYGADALRLYMINSPIVRAEPLRFQQQGVLNHLKEVFLPWFNAFRFFQQNSIRLESNVQSDVSEDKYIVFSRELAYERASNSENIMDKWILAALHGLIAFVDQEMKAYRLYTVIPRLVEFIDQLTNWYVRLNRDRLKNTNKNSQDCVNSLSTLFVVLVDLTTLMAPFTPFFTEYLYQMLMVPENTVDKGLFNYPKPESNAQEMGGCEKGAVKSVHFNMLPKANKELMNSEMEQQMKHMRDVISLCRLARGNDLPLKRPIKELILVHHDSKVLDSLTSVEDYIISESNVKKITKSNDEKKWCKLSARADGKSLGKKLGKKFRAVFQQVQKLTHEQLTEFQIKGEINILDEILTTEDIKLERSVIADENKFSFRVSDQNLCVILNIEQDEQLMSEYITRNLISKVQKLRKTSNVLISDVLDVFLQVEKSDEIDVEKALKQNHKLVDAKLKRKVLNVSLMNPAAEIVGEVEDDIEGVKVKIILSKPY